MIFPVGSLSLYGDCPAGTQIFSRQLGYGSQETYGTTTQLIGTWTASPDLRLLPEFPQDAKAALLTIKAKVKTVKWATSPTYGALQFAVRKSGSSMSTSSVAYAFSSKPAGFGSNQPDGGLVTEDLNYTVTVVALVDGKFEYLENITVGPYVTVDRVVFLTGVFNGT